MPMPPRDPRAPERKGTAMIRGRVVSMEAGTPLRRVQVRVFGQELRTGRVVLSDEQGRYEVKELPSGRYTLTASKGGYVMRSYGQRRPLDTGRPLEIADGQTLEKIDFALPRGGVIAGRIVDEFGEPVTDTTVSALIQRRIGGSRRLVPVMGGRPAQTNDIGQFRLFGLPPGEYYVAAGMQPGMFSMGEGAESTTGYAPTYYPGTPSLAEAQRVTVNVGEELQLELQLVPTRVSKITGTVTDSTGRAVNSGFVMLQPGEQMTMPGSAGGAPIRPDGTFTVSSVVPGSYHIVAQVGSVGPMEAREMASLAITVAGQDLDNVRLVTSMGATIQGRITYDGEGAPGANTAPTRLICAPVDFDRPMMMGASSGTADSQGQFELKGIHLPCVIRAMAPSPGWILKSVLHDGQDITDRPVSVSADKNLSGVEVVLTNRQTTLSGGVLDGQGRPLKEYVVVVFADDREKWGMQSRHLRTARADQEGQFKVMGLPPGQYLVVAVDTFEQGVEQDPEFLDRMRPLAVRTRLTEDSPQTIALKLTPQ
jgi:Carboxypeptidase regulatory-like domain